MESPITPRAVAAYVPRRLSCERSSTKSIDATSRGGGAIALNEQLDEESNRLAQLLGSEIRTQPRLDRL
jgi:hypothetical protein